MSGDCREGCDGVNRQRTRPRGRSWSPAAGWAKLPSPRSPRNPAARPRRHPAPDPAGVASPVRPRERADLDDGDGDVTQPGVGKAPDDARRQLVGRLDELVGTERFEVVAQGILQHSTEVAASERTESHPKRNVPGGSAFPIPARDYFFFLAAAAFLAALWVCTCGSLRYLDFFLLVARIEISPPLGPGTAPWTRMRLFSASMRTSFRLRMVTFSLP